MNEYQEKWVFPCNIKFFDIFSHFKSHNTVVWKKRGAIHQNDIVYIYIGAPYGEIRFKCHVINDNISKEKLEQNQYAIQKNSMCAQYIELKLDKIFKEKEYPFKELKENGIGQVQIPARVSRQLKAFLKSRGED